MDGAESFSPGEGATGGLEELSEDAKQRFAAAAKAMKQMRRDEKKAKKRDDQVARQIMKFLSDTSQTRFLRLISMLVARNCPSLFILGLLSLINEECLETVEEYFKDHEEPTAHETVDDSMALIKGGDVDAETNREMIEWITRLQMILAHDTERILQSLLIDEKHLDGSVLQLTVFILQEYFKGKDRDLPYEKAQPLTASILQTVFEPFMHLAKKKEIESGGEDEEDDDD